MYFSCDDNFLTHFRNLQQVFLYLLDDCNLRCVQCLYKPNLTFHLKEKEINYTTALELMSDFRELGATKLTLMGGEPTLYGKSQNHEPFLTLIHEAKKLGYEYVRIDTNGTFNPTLLEKMRELDEITFSLDGPTSAINDPIRGAGVFDKCTHNIRKAVELGYNVNITTCLHKGLIERDSTGKLLLDTMIDFVAGLGVKRVNFHDLFKSGLARDTWTGDLEIPLKKWLEVFSEIQQNIQAGRYPISVRIPQGFVAQKEFDQASAYYGYCSAKLGDRVLVHPDGIIRVCSLLIGTPYGIARYYDHKIVWDGSPTNELRGHDLQVDTPCTNQNKGKYYGDSVPLCVSFKPKQEEIVWQSKLNWESKLSEKK